MRNVPGDPRLHCAYIGNALLQSFEAAVWPSHNSLGIHRLARRPEPIASQLTSSEVKRAVQRSAVMTGSERLSALLALDDLSSASDTAGLLRDRGWNVKIAHGKAVLSALATGSQNVAVLECDGYEPSWADLQEVCTQLQERPQLLVVCAPGDVYQVLQVPARSRAYANRPAGPNLIAAEAEALVHGARSNLDACLCAGGIALDPVARVVYLPGSAMKLPKREFDLLHLLMRRRGEVVTREEAVRHVFRWDQDITSNAIDVHVHFLRRRLSRTLIRTVRGVGYVLD